MKNSAAQKLKQVPEGYLIIGVDPHKKKHAAVAITQDFTLRSQNTADNHEANYLCRCQILTKQALSLYRHSFLG